MKPELSIIIPCYNCEKTLKEAVESCFTQGLTSFEIVIVDDGSTDNTGRIMQELANVHEEIKLFYHEKNKGGGATRNTAVSNSQSEVIFCLDSDDILVPNMLPKMIETLKEKNADGIVFQETRFFYGTNTKKIEIVDNKVDTDKPVLFIDLFSSKGFLTQVNFMYTKKAFTTIGGYPTDHGFDTQSFGFKFLAKNLVVYVCPNTYYLHRRAINEHSYFNRSITEGVLSRNTYLILEEIIDVFSDSIIQEIFHYDIFNNNALGTNNLNAYLETVYIKNPNSFLRTERNTKSPEVKIINAIQLFKRKEYSEAINLYKEIVISYPNSTLIDYNISRNFIGLSGAIAADIEKIFMEKTFNLIFKKRKMRLYKNKSTLLVAKFISDNIKKIISKVSK